MINMHEAMTLYLVTDSAWSTEETFMNHVEEALKGGVTCIQLREKALTHEQFVSKAEKVKGLARKYNVPFIINDNVSVAVRSGADGVHIGQGDISVGEARSILGPDFIIGVTCKTIDEAKKAERDGANYIGSGAVFTTTTKTDTRKLDHKILKEICKSVSIPVVAIGGIDESNILELTGTGVAGAAVVSSILAKANKESAASQLKQLSHRMRKHQMPKVLTIAGSDCSGGAGIQADLKTMAAHKCYGMSVVTAITAQNTLGVSGVENCPPQFVKKQLEAVFTDIVPDAVKIGMVSSKEIIEAISEGIQSHVNSGGELPHIVLDPVMVSTSGSRLLEEDALHALTTQLMPLTSLITPNIPEAELLTGIAISTKADMLEAAKRIEEFYEGSILIKGGHLDAAADDLLYAKGKAIWFTGERVNNPNTHGTGCTLSSAIASNLALGYDLERSIQKSKAYLTGALKDKMDIGKGKGPLNHVYVW